MVIDPAVVKPAIESFNRIARVAPYPVTYHLPALYGTKSLSMYNRNVIGIIILGSAASVNDRNDWQENISDIMIGGITNTSNNQTSVKETYSLLDNIIVSTTLNDPL